jgi:hypothetical protein
METSLAITTMKLPVMDICNKYKDENNQSIFQTNYLLRNTSIKNRISSLAISAIRR